MSETGKRAYGSASKNFRIKKKNEQRRIRIFSNFVKINKHLAIEGWNDSSIQVATRLIHSM